MTYNGTVHGANHHAFSHADGGTRPAGEPLSSTTRYLSGAAYVDQKFAETVVDELVAQGHRAVAPALGYDIVTVIRHCFRAQRLWLAQNALLIAVLLLGAWLVTAATVTLYSVCLIGYLFLPNGHRTGRRPTWRAIAVIAGVLILASCLFGPLVQLVTALRMGTVSTSDLADTYGAETSDGAGSTLVKFLLGLVAMGLVSAIVLTAYRYQMISIVTGDLARGRAAGRLRPEGREVEQRLRIIGNAQHGNIVLHAGFEPFVGAGERVKAWSIATELRADEPVDPLSTGRDKAPRARVDIDPVDLVRHLRQRLAALRSRDLPDSSRVTGLQLRDQVISSGTRWHDYPLIDETVRLPYSFAETATVEAIIRAPQTSARHFLRASVGAPDRAAVGADGRTIMPAEHQSVISSTFIHVAVEGGLLYVELVAAVLGPIRQAYLDIDRYGPAAEPLPAAAGEAMRRFIGDVAVAPSRLVRGLYRRVTLAGAIHRADREAATEPVYDFGSRLDVRELASRPTFANYLQRLDAEKYTRLIDRRATEAIHEYLAAHGVDTSDFVAKVNVHQYNGTTIAGDAYGPIANGTGATATMAGVTVTAVPAGAIKGTGK
jgi:hypothetical protein